MPGPGIRLHALFREFVIWGFLWIGRLTLVWISLGDRRCCGSRWVSICSNVLVIVSTPVHVCKSGCTCFLFTVCLFYITWLPIMNVEVVQWSIYRAVSWKSVVVYIWRKMFAESIFIDGLPRVHWLVQDFIQFRRRKCGTYNNAGFTIWGDMLVLRFWCHIFDAFGWVELYIFCGLDLP